MAKSVRDESCYKYIKIEVADLAKIADLEDQKGLRGMAQVVHYCISNVWKKEVNEFRQKQFV